MRLHNLVLVFLFYSVSAYAYPEMTRHGYVNCTACHVSPSGSGLLNQYGRGISKEALSTWGREGEENFAYGALNTNEKVVLGAFIRGLQFHRETAAVREGRPIFMQVDAEAAYVEEAWAIDAAVGVQSYRENGERKTRAASRRHYFLYRFLDVNHFRVGKFQKFFGLNDPNHNLFIRRDIGFMQDTESYNAEFSYLGENVSLYATWILGNEADQYALSKEKGGTVSASYFFFDRQKVGVSYLRASDDTAERSVSGLWSIIAVGEKFYLLSEYDLQNRRPKSGSPQSGYVTSNRLNYELLKGVIPYVILERSHLDTSSDLNLRTGYGLGLQLFPRPHFEVVAQWENEKFDNVENSNIDFAYIMLNFYL